MTKKNNKCCTRRFESDAATVGQLRALEYAYKEGVVAYYSKDNSGNIFKVIKDKDGNFYKANTENGTRFDDIVIEANNVFVGPKGANEKIKNG